MQTLVTLLLLLTVFAPPVYQATMPKENAEELEIWRYGDSFAAVYVPAVRASSTLKPGRTGRYEVKHLQDRDLATAWVEGAKGNGTGEWLEFTFDRTKKDSDSGRTDVAVDGLLLFNGYRKSPTLWRENGRVRRMRLSVNGTSYGVLELKDTRTWQRVRFPKVPLPPNQKTVFRLTIDAVYPGSKYPDTALTEVEWEGVGVF
ncbi:MAG: hypothetical protein OHK0029_21820 [Armatimonadaceae bacterium]